MSRCVPSRNVFAFLGLHAVLGYDQRDTARRALLHQGEFLAVTQKYEAAAGQNVVNTLARHNQTHNYNVQMHVRQLEHEEDARFL